MARTSDGKPPWWKEPLVAVDGGPLRGFWFFEEDWAKRLRAAERMGRKATYREDGTMPHPEYPFIIGRRMVPK